MTRSRAKIQSSGYDQSLLRPLMSRSPILLLVIFLLELQALYVLIPRVIETLHGF